MGDGGLGHAQQLGDIAHAHLRFKEHIQDLDAGGVPEDLEQLRQVEEGLLGGHLPVYPVHNLLVDKQEIAPGGAFLLGHS